MERTVTVQEVMDREFVGVSESDTVQESAELMLSAGTESVVVLRGTEPVGVVSQRDALSALVEGDGDREVSAAMSEEVPTVTPETTIAEAADVMSSHATQQLVVTEGDRTVGALSEHDLITTSPFAPDRTADRELAVAGGTDERVAGSTAGADDRAPENADQGFEDQSICEACGSFARDLATFNGQLLCGDCRDI
jgi:CBS domain-containing protein